MKTFSIQTLGCKVNQYESEQWAALLRSRGMTQVGASAADLRIVNTCSVTMEAASKSRAASRRATRLPVLHDNRLQPPAIPPIDIPSEKPARVIVTGCWATSDPEAAAAIPGVDAAIGHHQNVAEELDRLLSRWSSTNADASPGESTGAPARHRRVNTPVIGTQTLPILGQRQTGHQRAFLKIQDGCDAHCTYCIIPTLRPTLWSKPLETTLDEARALVAAGHLEIVLTGIFLGAYGQPTALRRRQPQDTAKPLGELIDALCTSVPGLKRLRLSSLEPGDLTADLIAILQSHRQIVPHFHLPLQSGSDALLHRMNRQYSRDDFLKMVDAVGAAFDRPALTTDIIVGFPGETDDEFDRTLDVVEQSQFIHIHAFPFSARPGTAAARWKQDFVHGSVVNERIARLQARSAEHSLNFRRKFVGETVELLVERPTENETAVNERGLRHGRCERYFDVHFDGPECQPGDFVRVRVERAAIDSTHGAFIGFAGPR